MKKFYALFAGFVALTGFAGNTFAQARTASLPVVLVSFSADITGNKKIMLSWTTKQEVNTDCFDVEKSSDAIGWKPIATIHASGNSAIPVTYSAVDDFPLKGANYYRILIKSLSGNSGYTITKIVRMTVAGNISIYPNPASSLVNISLTEVAHASYWYLSVINSMGQVVEQKKYNNSITALSLPVSNYKNGMYMLEITDGNSIQSKKLMINHR